MQDFEAACVMRQSSVFPFPVMTPNKSPLLAERQKTVNTKDVISICIVLSNVLIRRYTAIVLDVTYQRRAYFPSFEFNLSRQFITVKLKRPTAKKTRATEVAPSEIRTKDSNRVNR